MWRLVLNTNPKLSENPIIYPTNKLNQEKNIFLNKDSFEGGKYRAAVFTINTALDLFSVDTADPLSLTRVRLLLCRAKNVVQLPDYHFVDHRIEIESHDKEYNKVNLFEHAEAHSGLPRQGKFFIARQLLGLYLCLILSIQELLLGPCRP